MLNWEDRNLTRSSGLSLKEIFFEVLMKDIVMENMQLFKGAETRFYEWVCFVACFLGSPPVSVEELDDTCFENFVSVGHCWGKGIFKFKPSCTTRLVESSIPADVLLSKKLVVLSYSDF